MTVRRMTMRWCVVSVAAYAMVLHALVMGVASAPRTASADSLIGTIQQLCSGTLMTMPGDGEPSSGSVRVMPCSLCGLGHADMDVPVPARFVPPVNIMETIALNGADAPVRPRLDFLADTRPRAPPAFV